MANKKGNLDWKKGHAKKGGRKKGTPNKFTTLTQAFLGAFQDKRIGGQEGLVKAFAINNYTKREFFKLIAKMLLLVDMGGEVNITHIFPTEFKPMLKKKDDK